LFCSLLSDLWRRRKNLRESSEGWPSGELSPIQSFGRLFTP
jgi:hypothetical protein